MYLFSSHKQWTCRYKKSVNFAVPKETDWEGNSLLGALNVLAMK
jgi:hypothetical protein